MAPAKSRVGLLCAAAGAAARRTRLLRAHECAHKFVLYQRSDDIYIDSLTGQKLARVFNFVNTRGLDIDRFEARGGKLVAIFELFHRTRHAPHPKFQAM